jgi:peptide deformylase
MAVLEVLTWPNPRLREKALPVERVDDELRRFLDDMLETMYADGGVGLAAIQVGDRRRVLVMDLARQGEPRQPVAMVNPEIVAGEGEIVWCEGCLSVPGVRAEVTRAERVVVEYLDRDGNAVRRECEGLESVCVQHEMDHLDGLLYFDRLGPLERKAVLLEYEALESAAGSAP